MCMEIFRRPRTLDTSLVGMFEQPNSLKRYRTRQGFQLTPAE